MLGQTGRKSSPESAVSVRWQFFRWRRRLPHRPPQDFARAGYDEFTAPVSGVGAIFHSTHQSRSVRRLEIIFP